MTTENDNEPVEPEADEKTPEQLAAEEAERVAQAEIESRAARMGWTPKDKFRGDPAKWTDAKTFVDRGEQLLPVLRERNRALDDRLARTEQALSKQANEFEEVKTRLGEATSAMKQFHEFSRKADERAFLRAKAEIEAKMAAAAAAADTGTYHVAKAELDSLERDRPEPPKAEPVREPAREAPRPAPAVDPEIPLWVAENQWYERDATMKAFANALNQTLLIERPGMSMRDNLAEVKRVVMERFPEKFENPRREAPPAVASPTAPAGASRKKGNTFDDIPAADRAAYPQFKKWMPDYTKEEYAKQYFAGDES